MLILHLGMIEDFFYLWGESLDWNEGQSVVLKEKKSQASSNSTYPFEADGKLLWKTLKDLGCPIPKGKKETHIINAWFPTARKKPLNSLTGNEQLPKQKCQLSPWLVSAIEIDTKILIDLLCLSLGKETLGLDISIGKDLLFWSQAFRFAGSLVARQKFLPGMVKRDDTYHAAWQTFFGVEDQKKREILAAVMPHSCRALSFDSDHQPDVSSLSVLTVFLNAAVDHLVRISNQSAEIAKTTKKQKKPDQFKSMHDEWLYALRSSDGVMQSPPNELAAFARQILDWQRPVSITQASPFRLCFRLEEPENDVSRKTTIAENTGTWFVRYLLQGIQDPSLLLPVSDCWNPKQTQKKIFSKLNFNPSEYLLFSLGQVSRISPEVEQSLKTSHLSGYTLDTKKALDFLKEQSLLIEQMGFGVFFPSWWTPKGTKQRLSLRLHVKTPAMKGASGFSMDDLVDFQWQAALGDEEISFTELKNLAKLKSSLVNIRGQWVQLNADEILEAIKYSQQKQNFQGKARDVLQMALGKKMPAANFALGEISAEGWMKDLLDQLNAKVSFAEINPPQEFQGTLRPYQIRGYSWLHFLSKWGLGACLADDMGLGKTIQTLALIQYNWHANSQKPVLLICPTSVVGNWQKEAERFTPELPVLVHHGLSRKKGDSFEQQVNQHAIVVSSYSLLHRDFELLKNIPWAGVILDEAQNIKNAETKQSKAARSLPASCRIALTGTPVENNVGDLWSIMEFLNPGFLGTKEDFKKRFFIPIQALHDPDASNSLKQLTAPFILRRLKTDKSIISDLPEKMEMKVYCNLTKEQASLYMAVAEDSVDALNSSDGIQRKGIILATLMKLKQICNHPAQFLKDNSSIPERSGKLARLTEMVEEILSVNEKLLIFSQFSEMGSILQSYLQKKFNREVFFLHGETVKKRRDWMVEQFQSDHGPGIFILSLKAGGTGLNLTRANHVFHFDRWWNPAVENQATDRVFRIGQTKNVQVHKYLCIGTLEEKIDEIIENKSKMANNIIGSGEGWLTELSTNELRNLFTLSKDAVAE